MLASVLPRFPRSNGTRPSWYQPYGLIGCSLVLRSSGGTASSSRRSEISEIASPYSARSWSGTISSTRLNASIAAGWSLRPCSMNARLKCSSAFSGLAADARSNSASASRRRSCCAYTNPSADSASASPGNSRTAVSSRRRAGATPPNTRSQPAAFSNNQRRSEFSMLALRALGAAESRTRAGAENGQQHPHPAGSEQAQRGPRDMPVGDELRRDPAQRPRDGHCDRLQRAVEEVVLRRLSARADQHPHDALPDEREQRDLDDGLDQAQRE